MVKDARVDAYVAEAAEFARPILVHLRELVHMACPEIEKSIKWRRPFFLSNGAIVANMAAFKSHCSFGLWGPGMSAILRGDEVEGDGTGGSLGRIESVEDLPEDAVVLGWLKTALAMASEARSVGGGAARTTTQKTVPKAAKGELHVPDDLRTALCGNVAATAHFEALSPSCKKEYVEWIEGAKRAETRAKRVAEAVAWIAEGRLRNWKYEAG